MDEVNVMQESATALYMNNGRVLLITHYSKINLAEKNKWKLKNLEEWI